MRVPAGIVNRGVAPGGGLGWMPCVPFAYNELTGEPISQCGSISDQMPCVTDVPEFPGAGYCPTLMPGYAGLDVAFRGLGTMISDPMVIALNDPIPMPEPTFPPCEAGSPLPCSTTGTGTAPIDPASGAATNVGQNTGSGAPCPAGYTLYGGAVCVPLTSPAGQAAQHGTVLSPGATPAWKNPWFIGGAVLATLFVIGMIRR